MSIPSASHPPATASERNPAAADGPAASGHAPASHAPAPASHAPAAASERNPAAASGHGPARHPSAGHGRNLEDLALPDVREVVRPTSTLLWPIGAVEQHGPHLPLSVDHTVAHESAQATAAECGEELDVWVLPTLSISKSDEHAWSPGSLWLSAETLLAVVRDVASSAAATTAERLVFLNAHGGNTALLGMACREVRRLFGLKTFLVHPFVPPDHGGRSNSGANELGMGIHGGHDETSVMLHLRPDLVRMDRAVRRVPERLRDNKHVRFGGGVSFGWLSNDFSPDGHIGDPTKASAEAGKQLFEGAVELLVEQLAEITTFDFGR